MKLPAREKKTVEQNSKCYSFNEVNIKNKNKSEVSFCLHKPSFLFTNTKLSVVSIDYIRIMRDKIYF